MRQFGAEAKRLRLQAGLTQQELADKVNVHFTMVGKIERAERGPQLEYAEALDVALETGGTLSRMWNDLHNQRYVPDWFKNALVLEQRATEIRQYQSIVIPGPLQTEDYARTLVREGYARADPEEIEKVVRTRVGRLPNLLREGKAELICYVIRESVFTDVMGDETIMRAQLRRIVDRVEEGSIQVQVLPTTVRSGIKGYLPFQLLTLGPTQLVGIVEHHEGGMVIDDPTAVRRMMTQFGQLQAEALSPADSLKRIHEILETHYGGMAQE